MGRMVVGEGHCSLSLAFEVASHLLVFDDSSSLGSFTTPNSLCTATFLRTMLVPVAASDPPGVHALNLIFRYPLRKFSFFWNFDAGGGEYDGESKPVAVILEFL